MENELVASLWYFCTWKILGFKNKWNKKKRKWIYLSNPNSPCDPILVGQYLNFKLNLLFREVLNYWSANSAVHPNYIRKCTVYTAQLASVRSNIDFVVSNLFYKCIQHKTFLPAVYYNHYCCILTHSILSGKILKTFFFFIFKCLRPEHDCYAKFTSCST